MEIKCGFNDEDEEDVAEMLHTKNLKEAAHIDKITKESQAKVMVHMKVSALTAALETTTCPIPAPENAPAPTPAPETAATLAPALAPAIN
jgi:hypothetical protein